MEESARRFARWVLLIHLLLLAGVVALVYLAAKEVYFAARQQAIEQAARRQALLTEQTSRGIESFYSSIVDNFELMGRTDQGEEPATAPAEQAAIVARIRPREARALIAPVLWQQLRNRASHFIIVDRSMMQPALILPEGTMEPGRKMVEQTAAWLAGVNGPAVSKLVNVFGDQPSTLVCVPVGPNNRTLLVAVVPLKKIEEQFLQAVNANKLMSAMLLDENLRVMAGFNPSLIGLSVADDASDPNIRRLAERYLKLGAAGTEVIESGFNLGDHRFEGGIVSIQPVEISGKRWWLTIGSSFSEVDSVVKPTFRSALTWALFVVGSITAILVSTAFQMIRSRARLERTRREMLERELSQARQIQLAWLPEADGDLQRVTLSAVNKPASHISGDFYNWFDLPDGRVCVVIGDVTGHGMSAAFLMATTQLLTRAIMPRVTDPGRCLEEVNRQLCQQMFNGQFVTMLIVVVDPANSRMDVAAAGHPPPLIGNGESFKALEVDTHLVLGVEPDVKYRSQSVDLPQHAWVVLYTDGVVETYSPDGRQFGVKGLVATLQAKSNDADAQSISRRVVEAVDAFRAGGEVKDDLTLVTIQPQPITQPRESLTAAT
ncbi:MAG TPA: PP2C family protein-serine/threonine phosphatase [Tepidisphaeraceae bacterium]